MAEWAIEIDLCLFLFVLQVKDKAYRISSNKTLPQIIPEIIITPAGLLRGNRVSIKDFRASGLGQVRHLTAATAAITLAQWVRRVQKRNFGPWISSDFVVLVNSLGFK